jgi:Predicted periplasmic protein
MLALNAHATAATQSRTESSRAYWAKRITEAERLATFYSEEARKRNAPHLGTMFNEYHVPKHTCAVLGRMLGKEKLVGHLERWDKPAIETMMSEDDLTKLRLFVNSMDNFAEIAKTMLKASEPERINLWNLECVGKHNIPASASISTAGIKTSFRVDGNTLFVVGNIEKGFGEAIARAIAENPGIDTVAFGSAGGSLSDAIKAGSMIRALGLSTTLWSNCYSACTIAFLGGVRRLVWSPYAELGFHQVSIYGVDISPGSDVYGIVARYAANMGVNPRFLLAAMFSATNEKIYVPEIKVLCEQDVVTWVQRACDGAGRRYQ